MLRRFSSLFLFLSLITVSVTTALSLTSHAEDSINLVQNGGFEQVGGWQQEQNKATGATFNNQLADAHSGNFAAAVTNITDDTEVGYATTVQSPAANQHYNLSFWQKGDIYAYAFIAFQLQDGTTTYQSLASVPATRGEWSKYSDSFITPANVANMQLTIATSGTGTITIDDVALTEIANDTQATFPQGMISLTFDDGTFSAYANGLPVLKQYKYKGTFYLNAGNIDKKNFVTKKQAKTLASNGQEIGTHLFHHSDMVQIDRLTLDSELRGNKQSLLKILGSSYPLNSFASPYGSFTSGKLDTVFKYANSHRTTDDQLNTRANLNERQIHARLVTSTTTLEAIKSWIEDAKTKHAWLVLAYHNIAPTTSGQDPDVADFNVKPEDFKNQVAAVKASGLPVHTVSQALAILSKQ